MTDFAVAGFWFFLGFFLATWLAYKAQDRKRAQAAASFLAAKNQVIQILNSVKEMTEITVTIKDETGELKLETEEPPAKKGLH